MKKIQGQTFARTKGLNKVEVGKFFRNLSAIYEELELWKQPGKISDADESGLQLIFKRTKVISKNGKKETGKAMPPIVIMKMVRQRTVHSKIIPGCQCCVHVRLRLYDVCGI